MTHHLDDGSTNALKLRTVAACTFDKLRHCLDVRTAGLKCVGMGGRGGAAAGGRPVLLASRSAWSRSAVRGRETPSC